MKSALAGFKLHFWFYMLKIVSTSESMQMSSSSKFSIVEMLSKPSSAVEGEGCGLSKISKNLVSVICTQTGKT